MRNRSTGKCRDELLDWENFYTLIEPKILDAPWRRQYNYGAATGCLGLSATEAVQLATLSGFTTSQALS